MKYRASNMLTGAGTLVPAIHPNQRRHSPKSKTATRLTFALGILMTLIPFAQAAVLFSPGYSGSAIYTHNNSNSVYSYDWGADGKIYLGTADSNSKSGGIYSYDGISTSTIQGANNTFAGVSVVRIGSSIYFNDADSASKIYRYDVSSGVTTSVSATNYSLGTDGANLVTTGSANFVTTDINYYAGGALTSAIALGGVAGYSGPVAFDMVGNLFYAPGYGDTSIYRWSAIEVAAAVLGNGSPALSAVNRKWVDYGSSFSGKGASSLLLDANGNVLVTLTEFNKPSSLVKFDSDGSGNFETILTSGDRLGDLRLNGGNLYLSETNKIITIIPEPSAMLIALAGCGLLLKRKR